MVSSMMLNTPSGRLDPAYHNFFNTMINDKLLELMEQGDNVDVIYLDFSKTFNKVNHGLLLRKMD